MVFGYDGRGLIGSVWHKKNGSGQNLSYRDYWRDDRDRITAWRKSLDASLNPMENGRGDRYGYDEAGQLTLASYQTSNPNANGADAERVDIFGYGALGNRMQDNHLAGRGWMNFTRDDNGLNQYTGWWPYNFIKYDDDIGAPWGAPHAANGVIMQDGWITAGFNALNQPKMISSQAYNGTADWMWFGFDPLGRCVKRWVSSSGVPTTSIATFYYYDGWNLLQEGASGANAQRLYIHGGRVDDIVKSFNYTTGQSAYHHYDARGHCTMLTDPNGDILEQYDYDAFGFPYFYDGQGNSLTFYDTPSGSVRGVSPYGNRFLFTGREWLTDLKLYDYRNRMYQPELGRFLQPDPKQFEAGDYNLYRYCHNDPINHTDPTGLYGMGKGWTDETWKKFDHAQQTAAARLEKTSAKMDPKVFEKVFGKGSATAENMANVQHTMQGMAAALRDDGTNGHVANAFSDPKSSTLGLGNVNGNKISINVGHPGFGVPGTLTWTVGHESGHNLGLDHARGDAAAYKYGNAAQREVYKNLPTPQRLNNPDNYMEFSR